MITYTISLCELPANAHETTIKQTYILPKNIQYDLKKINLKQPKGQIGPNRTTILL